MERYYGEEIGVEKKVQMPIPTPSFFGRQLRKNIRPEQVYDDILPESSFSLW